MTKGTPTSDAAGRLGPQTADAMLFRAWGRDRKGWRPVTCTYYARRAVQADGWLTRHRGVELKAATTDQLHDWLDTCPPHPQTRNTYLAALIAYFDWTVATGIRPDNPARAIERLRERPSIPKAPGMGVIDAVLAAADRDGPRLSAAMHLMAYGGLRIGEVVGLEWVDWSGDWLRVTGKGGRTRTIPVHPRLREALNAWRSSCPSARWVFPTTNRRDVPLTTGTMRSRVKEVMAAAGYPDLIPHELRHGAATRLLECGADVATVSAYLGHASLNTTSVYLKVRPERLFRAVMALDHGPDNGGGWEA
jgi:integrase